jgi:hypothetical protein
MVWLTGGDTNSLDDFWSEGPAANDQSASAFRKAGMAMLFPTLRGGNDNPGQREYFWGRCRMWQRPSCRPHSCLMSTRHASISVGTAPEPRWLC